ncbi:MAG: alpha/beta hydrolase [Longimicrobiales bacterium]
MVEHSIQVRRTARYYAVGEPGPDVRQVWIVCHGYGQLARDFVRLFRAIESPSRWIVAPEALNRYYVDTRPVHHGPESAVAATWMTREDRLHEIEDYVAYLNTLHGHLLGQLPADPRPEVFALGFSQGAATVARWVSRAAARIDHVVLWGSMLPAEIEPTQDLFGSARLTVVAGTRDRAVGTEAIRALEDRFQQVGRQWRLVRFEGGHHLDSGVLGELAGGL